MVFEGDILSKLFDIRILTIIIFYISEKLSKTSKSHNNQSSSFCSLKKKDIFGDESHCIFILSEGIKKIQKTLFSDFV